MRIEAYTVGFDPRNYHAPIPSGYSKDEITRRREGNIRDNIIRYLGEYRLGVKFDEIRYSVKTNNAGETYLESPHADPGPILNVYKKAIAYRQERGLSVHREVAECLGFQKLQDKLVNAPVGTMAMWVSRPGSKEDGYGTHSFTFLIQVVEDPGEGKSLRVIPYRNEQSIEEQKSNLIYFDKNAQNYNTDVDLLANPSIINQSDAFQTLDDIISFIGETEKFNIQWRNKLTPLIMPLIGGFIQLVREKASDENLQKARYAIENFLLAKKDYILGKDRNPQLVFENQPRVIFERYGNTTPPIVGGSCGASANGESSNTFNNVFLEDKYGSRIFSCPECGKTNIRPENELLSNCQHCGSDKVSCCDVDRSSFVLVA
ncbi:MAG: hypothetical protein A2958_01655 [Candidatus Levybacteria bacterium RIFCSPLOWO2_01_FULL_38_13]|nr:MAG: hypothetical protein A2629_01415 [Candidatus Levybacteria bacterium RIFCSPHIGHO2_01_FULL_41_15]OGH34650.1 MAG: hypothetical protein A2958_01655 [Candidatus Levybacteria bacterium RIFCSPLOWO2_01_FULL_38_13]